MKVLTKILAAFMSVILVILLIATPLVSFAATAVNKNLAREIISDADIKNEIIDFSLGGDTQGIAFMQAFIESKCFDEIFTEAANYIISPLFHEYPSFTSQDVMNIVEDNIDELVQIVRETSYQSILLTDKEIESAIISSLSMTIPSMMNEIEDTKKELWPDLIEAATILGYIKIAFYIVLGVIVLLTALIALCTFRKFNAFIWICVDYGIAAFFTFTTIAVMNIMFVSMTDFSTDPIEGVIINFISDKLTNYYTTTGIIYAVIFVLCLAAAIVFKTVFRKKKAAAGSDQANEQTLSSTEINSPFLSDTQQSQPSPEMFSATEEFTFVNSDNNN